MLTKYVRLSIKLNHLCIKIYFDCHENKTYNRITSITCSECTVRYIYHSRYPTTKYIDIVIRRVRRIIYY